MINAMLYTAAALLLLVSLAHSWLGERYILQRLFRRDDLPKLFGGTDFTRLTLRFAWHLTSVAWLGFAALLLHLAQPPISASAIGTIVAVVFAVHGLGALVGSRGRHLSWIPFLAVAVLVLVATRG